MFTKEIEEALAAKRVDLAVHSLKDLPTDLPAGFALAAVTEREDPRDVLLSASVDSVQALPQKARVGTSSLRRQAQLKAVRADLDIHPLRGNVDTRVRKLKSGEYAAIILAAAGLNRLGLAADLKRTPIPADVMCPAAGQGALGIEVRADDSATAELLKFLDHPPTRRVVDCERRLLSALGGGCQVPIGAHAEARGNALRLTAIVARPDGTEVLRESVTGDDAHQLASSVAQALFARGAKRILDDVYGAQAAVPNQP